MSLDIEVTSSVRRSESMTGLFPFPCRKILLCGSDKIWRTSTTCIFFPLGPFWGRGAHNLVCSALSTTHLRPSRSSAILSHLFTSTLSRFLLTLSLHLNVGVPLLPLSPSSLCNLNVGVLLPPLPPSSLCNLNVGVLLPPLPPSSLCNLNVGVLLPPLPPSSLCNLNVGVLLPPLPPSLQS